jgi:hypothetical protein
MTGGSGNSGLHPIGKRCRGYRNIASCEAFFEFIEQLGLAPLDFGSVGIQIQPRGAIDLWKGCDTAAFGRPSISKELLISDAVSKSASTERRSSRGAFIFL